MRYLLICIAIAQVWGIMNYDVKSDYKKWKESIGINHSNEGWIRAVALSVPVTVLVLSLCWYNFFWYAIPVCAGLVAWYYWTIFDGRYNNKRRFNWWFTGSDDDGDARTDNFLQRLTKWQAIAIKIGGCLLFTAGFVLLWIYSDHL
jgi:hypothetical protein